MATKPANVSVRATWLKYQQVLKEAAQEVQTLRLLCSALVTAQGGRTTVTAEQVAQAYKHAVSIEPEGENFVLTSIPAEEAENHDARSAT
jgi:pyrrolidone-carboxylate peptidase